MAQTVYWVIYPVTGGTDPGNNTTGAAFVRNGQDGAGVTAAASGSEAMPGGTGTINVDEATLPTNLTPGTSYKVAATIWDGTTYGGGTSTYVTVSVAIDTLPILDLAGSRTASLSGVVTASGDLQYTISLGGAQTASLSGSLDVAGDIEITPAPTLDLAGSQTAALGGVLSATGDLQYGLSTDLAQSAAAALSGSLSIAGDLEYSTAVFLDIAAQPITLAGAFSASGDLDPYPSLDLAGSRTAALSGSVTVTGDLQSVVPFDLAFSASTAISGSLSVTGNLEYSTTPITTGGRIVRRGRTKFSQPIPDAPQPEEVRAKSTTATLVPQDAMQLLMQDALKEAGKAIKKARVASVKRRIKIEQEDERAIERALLDWF